MDAELDEAARVGQQIDPFARRQLADGVLPCDLLLPAAELRSLAADVEVVDQALETRFAAVLGLRRRLGRLALALGLVIGFSSAAIGPQRPFHSGSRFSKNAVTPSIASSVASSIVSWERR